jgi:aspartate carbamoyltransferase catalytic subunit
MADARPQTTAKDRRRRDVSQIHIDNVVGANSARVNTGSLLSVADLSLAEIGDLLKMAVELQREDASLRARRLAGKTVALLFCEASTRTRVSFELAAKSLGALTVLVTGQASSIEKGESLKDTGLTLKATGADCIVLRHPSSGAPYLLARETGLPVLNAGDGMHEHPSQALLDLQTILTRLKRGVKKLDAATLHGVTVTICGDILHSRVARSNALLLPRLGAKVIFCGPPALLPEIAAEIGPGIKVERELERAMKKSQVVMMLRIQKERMAGLDLKADEYVAQYQLTAERVKKFAAGALVMHPGPVMRGLEMTSEAVNESAMTEQVAHGLAVRRALLMRALAEGGSK